MTTLLAASPGCHESRPGRPVVVAASLADLQGQAGGVVKLPQHLFWCPDRTFDLGNPRALRWMYENVLREASRADDLRYLNGPVLAAVWTDLWLPRGVRAAWEDQHPAMRAAAAPAA